MAQMLLATLEDAHLLVEGGDSCLEARHVLVVAFWPYVLKWHVFDSCLCTAGSGGCAGGRGLRLVLVVFARRVEPRVLAFILGADLGGGEVFLVGKVNVDVGRRGTGRT
eukprot:1365840-Pleurochrysis_carterae.AAC.1